MWWRILTFCLLVTLILFVVLSCIHGRPVIHLFFHRCCDDDIENDQVLFENFGNEFLKERLISSIEDGSFNFTENDLQFDEKTNVHDPRSRVHLELTERKEDLGNGTMLDIGKINYTEDELTKGKDNETGRRIQLELTEIEVDKAESNGIERLSDKVSVELDSSEATTVRVNKISSESSDSDSSDSSNETSRGKPIVM